jgi:hypothetical protein
MIPKSGNRFSEWIMLKGLERYQASRQWIIHGLSMQTKLT